MSVCHGLGLQSFVFFWDEIYKDMRKHGLKHKKMQIFEEIRTSGLGLLM